MASTPEYKTGDDWPPLSGTVTDLNGEVNISGANHIRVILKGRISGTIIASNATIIDDGTVGLRGKWQYNWATNDLLVADTYEVEIEVTWALVPLKIQTFPNAKTRNPTVSVTEDLD
jgi:hypothetical protein